MTRRDHAVVAALVILLVALGGAIALPRSAATEPAASPTPAPTLPPPVTYREGVVGTPVSITPVTARSRSERLLVGLVFNGLVRLGPESSFQPDLASSWTSNDAGTEWTFTIRDDATWQDGVPVTSDDVVYTVDALRDPDSAGAMAAAWAEISASAIDPKTVRFTLASPIAGFLAVATQPLLPAHLLGGVPFADLATDPFASHPVGTGPYVLSSLDATEAVLTPRALAGPGEAPPPTVAPPTTDALASPAPTATPGLPIPYLERIELRFYDDAVALASAFRGREVDAASGLPPDAANALGGLAGAGVVEYPTTTLTAALLNLRPSHPELRDPRVRLALLGVLDRNELVDTVLHGAAVRADALVPPGSWAYDPTAVTQVAVDPKQAATQLTAAGWKRFDNAWWAPGAKTPYTIELLTVDADVNPRLAAIAEFVRDAWTSLGIEVDLEPLPADDLAPRLRKGDFGAAIVDIAMGLEPDLYPLLASSQVRASGTNLSGYQDATLDPLLEAARAPGTDAARKAAWTALLAGLSQRQPILPLAWGDDVLVERGVTGIHPRLISGPGDRFWDVLSWRLAASR